MFRDDPQVHVIGHWNYPAGTVKPIYVASNCQDVELFVNGKSLGHGKNSNRYLFTFENVSWAPGEIKAAAYNQGQPVATHAIRTARRTRRLAPHADHRSGRPLGRWLGHHAS